MKEEKICFVVMGFGKKTDYETRRTLDLDATYEAIIQPAVAENGLRCIRANEILHSGVIDVKMYEMLLRADLVIADISTGNVNAVYELGVRHALRPHATVIMKEKKGRLYFDLNHVNTFEYEHMGDDIGNREAKRAKAELTAIIRSSMGDPTPDSPVYTFLPALQHPRMTDEEYEALLDQTEEVSESFSKLLSSAEEASERSDHKLASKLFADASNLSPNNSYLIQQNALHTYKSKIPSENLALDRASNIINRLSPEKSNDPETLGIAGAIYKNMWRLNEDLATLDKAISFYQRGFEVRGDYYNGENAANCLSIRSSLQTNKEDQLYDRISAKKIREEIVTNLKDLISSPDFSERTDQMWIFATMANCLFALGNIAEAGKYEVRFIELKPKNWQLETFRVEKETALKISNGGI